MIEIQVINYEDQLNSEKVFKIKICLLMTTGCFTVGLCLSLIVFRTCLLSCAACTLARSFKMCITTMLSSCLLYPGSAKRRLLRRNVLRFHKNSLRIEEFFTRSLSLNQLYYTVLLYCTAKLTKICSITVSIFLPTWYKIGGSMVEN